jgi:hypothetical protein
MASHYIEEYLVSLGFDLDSKEGKEYLKVCADIEKKQKEAEKAGKSADTQAKKDHTNSKRKLDDGKKEVNLMVDLEKTLKQIGSLTADVGEGNIFASLLKGAATVKTLTDFMHNLGSAYEDTGEKAKKNKTTTASPGSNVFKTAKESAKGAKAGATEEQGLQAGITGASAGEAGAAGLGGVAAVAGPIAAAAAIIAAGIAMKNMADEVSQTSINIQTMSRQLWISDTRALALNNTLTAMGKTTADLNEIALNPTLRKQYEDLMAYQQKELNLPADFMNVQQRYAETVGTTNSQLKETINNVKQIMAYNFDKKFGDGLAATNDALMALVKFLAAPLGIKVDNTKKAAAASGAAGYTAPYSASSFAPQTSNYTSSSQSGMTIHNEPNITVNATSNDPQAIGQATANAIAQNFGYNSFVTKFVQTQNR